MKKTILFVIESLACGGAEKSLVTLLRLLDYSKLKVDLLLYKRGGMFETLLPTEVHILPALEYSILTTKPLYTNILKPKVFLSRLRYAFARKISKGKGHNAQIMWACCSNSIDKLKGDYDVAIAYNQGFSTYFVAEKVNAKKKFA